MFGKSPLSATERTRFPEPFLSVCAWTQVYCMGRSKLREEGDNHLIELTVAGGAAMMVTNNVRDFRKPDLLFPSVRVLTPEVLTRELA